MIAHRDGETWTALCSDDAGWTWVSFPDDGPDNDDEPNNSELGVLAVVGDLDQPGTVTVELDGRAVTATVDLPHWAALFTGVDADSLSRVQVRNQD
ncbi:MAG: hypothetical protein JWN87_3383 [Frankiales bacterium]|nr:hypothetical protein [Frankiales bacterium]